MCGQVVTVLPVARGSGAAGKLVGQSLGDGLMWTDTPWHPCACTQPCTTPSTLAPTASLIPNTPQPLPPPIAGESKPKHAVLFEARGPQFRLTKYRLRTVRPFVFDSVALREAKPPLAPEDQEAVARYLVDRVRGEGVAVTDNNDTAVVTVAADCGGGGTGTSMRLLGSHALPRRQPASYTPPPAQTSFPASRWSRSSRAQSPTFLRRPARTAAPEPPCCRSYA